MLTCPADHPLRGVFWQASTSHTAHVLLLQQTLPLVPPPCSVASTDRDGQLASNDLPWSSNYGGNTITLAAPGVDILGPALSGNVTTATGTSFAVPQVAGAVALLMAEAQARGAGA